MDGAVGLGSLGLAEGFFVAGGLLLLLEFFSSAKGEGSAACSQGRYPAFEFALELT